MSKSCMWFASRSLATPGLDELTTTDTLISRYWNSFSLFTLSLVKLYLNMTKYQCRCTKFWIILLTIKISISPSLTFISVNVKYSTFKIVLSYTIISNSQWTEETRRILQLLQQIYYIIMTDQSIKFIVWSMIII